MKVGFVGIWLRIPSRIKSVNRYKEVVAVLQTAVVALVVVTAAVKRRGKRRAVTKLDIKGGN
jgi:hypothetical protein